MIQSGKRKSKRELSFRKSTHLVLRLRTNLPSLFAPRDHVLREDIFRCADKYGIKIYNLVFNHSHLHGVLLLPNRAKYVSFIRELTAMITRHFNQSANIPGLLFKNIFSKRLFLRSVPWGKAYRTLQLYMRKNEAESGVAQGEFNGLTRLAMIRRKFNLPKQMDIFELQV